MRLIDADALKTIRSIQSADYNSIETIQHWIDNAPTIDATPIKHGHWLYDYCDIVCSECGTRYNDELCYMLRSDCSYNEPRYCPWCGARMDAKE